MAYKNKSKSRKHFGRKEYNETIEGRVQIKNKSYGKTQNSKEFLLTQTTWRREKKKPKAGTEKKLKLRKKKKGKSPNQSQKLRQETNHMEERKKKNPKAGTEKK